jgi:hypothetical protein
VLYGDDSQITDVVVRKRYCLTPRTEIVLREVGAGQRSFIVDESAVCSQEFAGALTCGGRRTG